MREILFRGKLHDGSWAYGNLDVKQTGVCIITPDSSLLGSYGQVDPATVGQYTGLTDKNGKKVFEGDTLLVDGYPDFPLYIAFDHGMFCFKSKKHIHFFCAMLSGDRFVVTGNIHDNPELLKGGAS